MNARWNFRPGQMQFARIGATGAAGYAGYFLFISALMATPSAERPVESGPPARIDYDGRIMSVAAGWSFALEEQDGRPPVRWKPVRLPHNWNSEGVPKDRSVFGWYRLRFRLDRIPDHPLGIMPGMVDSVDRVWLNAGPLGGSGSFEPRVEAFDEIRLYYLPPRYLRAGPGVAGENEIVLRVSNLARGGTGGIKESMHLLGPHDLLQNRLYYRDLPDIGFSVMALVVAAYFLLFYLRRRGDRENLYFALTCVIMGCYFVLRTQARFQSGLDFLWLKRLEYLLFFMMPGASMSFLLEILELNRGRVLRRIWQAVLVISIPPLAVVAFSPDYFHWTAMRDLVVQPLLLLCVVPICFGATLWLSLRGSTRARVILFGCLVMTISAFNDIMISRGVYAAPAILTYGFAAMLLSIAALLSGRFVQLHNRVEELNQNLERKVALRTAELEDALEKITRLKNSQDGDYFLTSLLLEPLQVDRNTSETVTTETYISQFKKFRFRRWQSELGGDLTVVGELSLGERRHVAFINGDAMGKSMQGAGGALILGVIFHAALERARVEPPPREAGPEGWLLATYRDLQRVFVTFEGSMYVSVTMGLLDEVNGMLYYCNAEHPRPVLYRDGEAGFLDGPRELRKIGTPDGEENFLVETCQLMAGDILFTGSDGRDDLALPDPDANKDPNDTNEAADSDAGGSRVQPRIINEDEHLFPRLVREARGDLGRLAAFIQSSGEPIDDISLIKIAYRPGEKSSGVQPPIEQIRQADKLAAAQDFAAAAELYGQAAHFTPADPVLLYRQARCYFKSDRHDLAAATVERMLLREPDNLAALILSAEIDAARGRRALARRTFGRARAIAPDDRDVRRLGALPEFA